VGGMKISIEIDLQPGEIHLATELFSVLRQISNTFTTRNTKQLFSDLLQRLQTDEASFEVVILEINQILTESASEEVFQDFISAFFESIFTPTQSNTRSYIPAVFVLPR
jgi:hypothetical protein